MRIIPTILVAVLMLVSIAAALSSAPLAATGASVGAAVSASSDGTAPTKSAVSPAVPIVPVPIGIGPSGGVSVGSATGCGAADSVACAPTKSPSPAPAISCSGVASDAAVASCIKSTIQSGTLGTPVYDKAAKAVHPTSMTSCVLNPNSFSISTGASRQIYITCFNEDGTDGCPSMGWSATIGSVDATIFENGAMYYASSNSGSGSVVAAGIGVDGVAFSCSSQVAVISAPVPVSCFLSPPSLSIGVNQHQTFIASCSDVAGNEVSCPAMAWSSTIGTVTSADDTYSADFVSASAGSGTVRATGRTPQNSASAKAAADSAVGTFSCQSPVTVSSTPTIIYSCAITPSSLTIQANGQQTFAVTCYGKNGTTVRCSNDLAWNTNVGTLSAGPAKVQSIIFTAQSNAGSGIIQASGSSTGDAPTAYSCSAPITVTSTPAAIASIRLVPSSLKIAAGGTQQFIAQAYDAKGNYIRDLSNSEVGWSMLSISVADVGKIDSNGVFTATGIGSTTVRGTYNAITPSAIIYADAPVSVTSGSIGPVASITVMPSSASLYTGQTQQFTAMAYDANGNFLRNLSSSDVAWAIDNAPIGTVSSNGLFQAVGIGTANISATYVAITPASIIQGKAVISVSSLPPVPGNGGGNGGSGATGGGSFRTSTTASITCAGQPGSIAITYYDSKAPSATVNIYYKGDGIEQVLSRSVSSTTSFSFTPPKAGPYEIHVSIGTDQTTRDFQVPTCTPSTVNVTQNVTINLQPVRELLLKRDFSYKGGISKEFRVYKITSADGSVDYSTEVDLTYTANGTVSNITINDGVPKSVLASFGQVAFQTYPSDVSSDPNVHFSWLVKSAQPGQTLKYSYSMGRMLTSQMIDSFSAPYVLTSLEREALITGRPASTGSDLLASMVGIGGFSLSVSALLVILGLVLVAALLYMFVFGKKKED